MSNFSYKKRFYITDAQAKELKITIEAPIVCFYQDKKGRVYLTAANIYMLNYRYIDLFSCILKANHWLIDMYFPFPWEDNYRFIKKQQGIYQLMDREIAEKEFIAYVKPKVKTLSRERCRKTKRVQDLCKPKPPTNWKDPNLFDTLQ